MSSQMVDFPIVLFDEAGMATEVSVLINNHTSIGRIKHGVIAGCDADPTDEGSRTCYSDWGS
jgi:hypothetical protein